MTLLKPNNSSCCSYLLGISDKKIPPYRVILIRAVFVQSLSPRSLYFIWGGNFLVVSPFFPQSWDKCNKIIFCFLTGKNCYIYLQAHVQMILDTFEKLCNLFSNYSFRKIQWLWYVFSLQQSVVRPQQCFLVQLEVY